MKKILLITGSFGNGHLQVSNNIKSMFEKKYNDEVQVVESDLFLQAHPNLTPVLKQLYLYSFSYFRDIYGYLYYAGKNNSNSSFYRYFSYEYLKKLIKKENPDIIVSTFPTPALSLVEDVPVVNVVTDYHFHKSWLTKDAIAYYVATEESKKRFIEVGVSEERIKIFGLPISEKFDEAINKNSWLLENDLFMDKTTILLSAGAFGVSQTFAQLVEKIIRELSNIQVVIVCGKNKELKLHFDEQYADNKNIKVLGYTNDMRKWMQVSDLLVTKAGGVTISEALASSVPLVLYKPVPGQEKENALYFEKKGMAKIANNDLEVVDIISDLILNNKLEIIKENMKKNYLPKATERICLDIIKLIKQL